jgi:ACS family tartrate transporter-like MFS transporter
MNYNQASSVEYRTRRKIAVRLLPFIFLLYIINFLDRTNVGVAKLRMVDEPWFNDWVFGIGSGVFFIGYLALEIPGALLVERWSARRWIARILISWGLCTVLVGLVRDPLEFYGARFLLGLAEAGFFPGILVYLTHWIYPGDRARAMSVLMLGVPCAMGLGAVLAGPILELAWFGVPGWRWLFILEGLPAVVLGFVTLFYLTDHPRDARWLEPEERDWIERELEAEKRRKSATAHLTIWQAFRERNVLLLTAILFLAALPNYAFMFWLPTIVKDLSGLPDRLVAPLSGLPYVAAVFGAVAAT